MQEETRTRISVLFAVVALAAGSWVVFGPTASAQQSNFVGGDPTRPDASDIRASRIRFEAGSRSNWHSHGNWQIIMAEEGRGRTQVRGEAIMELRPGNPVHAGPGVVHWHGAAPDEHMVQLTFSSGVTSWLDPVSEDDYLGR